MYWSVSGDLHDMKRENGNVDEVSKEGRKEGRTERIPVG